MKKAGMSEEELAKRFAELDDPEVKEEGYKFVYLFSELQAARQAGMNGPLPISYLEMASYLELMCVELDPFEIKILKSMDRAYLEELQEITKEQ